MRSLVRLPRLIILHFLVVSPVLLGCSLFSGCSDDSSGVNPGDRLCGGKQGFAALIEEGAEPVEMCVSDAATIADFIPDPGGDKYEIRAAFSTDSLTIEVEMSFFVQPTFPATLTLTTNRAEADSDPGAVWFLYRETKLAIYDYVSTSVSGLFTLIYNDSSIAVARFSGMELALDDASSGDPAGVRNISDGYVSVTGE